MIDPSLDDPYKYAKKELVIFGGLKSERISGRIGSLSKHF